MCRASWKTPSKIFIRITVENSSAMCEPVSQLWTTWIILGTSSITSQLNVNTHLYHHLYSISSSIYHHLYHHLSCHHRHHATTGIYQQSCVNGWVYQLMVNLLPNHTYIPSYQGGRSWQPFGEGKIGHKNFRQVRNCYFRDKCIVFACNCKFANLTHYKMQ